MVKIEIDGKSVDANQGAMIIEVADKIGIAIPRFCYHEKLSIAANCRMCLVEVENAPKPMPACATPVSEGMKIRTCSKKAQDAQKAVMEFLLINHPLDCPVCDQGGQCELQDIALEYGRPYSEFAEGKRSVADKDIGPLISTEMTRCIHCTRCVRFGDEIAGQRELGGTGRGEHMQIGTYIEKNVNSEISGNVIDLCPVGALTNKPFRFKGRAWEMMARSSISPHDAVGANLFYHVLRGKIMRTVPKENESVNEIWLSDRDRYSHEGLYNNRLTAPMIKKNGVWETVDWAEALPYVVEKLSDVLEKKGPEALGALVSPNVTLEEAYLLQKLLREKGIQNIDHRLKQSMFTYQSYQAAPSLGVRFEALEEANAILLVGCDIRHEAPLLAIRIRKAVKQGAEVFAIHPVMPDFNFPVMHCLVEKQGQMVLSLLQLLKALLSTKTDVKFEVPVTVQQALDEVELSEEAQHIAQKLSQNEKQHLILGAYASTSLQADWIYYLTRVISEITGATWGELSNGANSAGCWIAGLLPHQGAFFNDKVGTGKHVQAMLNEPLDAYCLVGIEPDFDFIDPLLARKALEKASFVVAMSAHDSANLRECADVLLPIVPHTETKGTFVNAQGDWQHFEAACSPLENSKPLWKVIRVLGNFWHAPGMEYETLTEVFGEVKEQYQQAHMSVERLLFAAPSSEYSKQIPDDALIRLAPTPLYSVDALVRNAPSLQKTVYAQTDKVWLNQDTADKYQIKTGDSVIVEQATNQSEPLYVVISDKVPLQTVIVPNGIAATRQLGAGFESINLRKCNQG